MKILYVENDAVFASVVVAEFLEDHDVVVVPTVEQAMARARAEPFDAALVDYDLDDGKGSTVVRGLRSLGFGGRIVAVSSHQAGNTALREAGADDTCPKLSSAQISEHLADESR